MDSTPEVYKIEKLTFIILPEKIVVKTSLGQTFYLRPKAHYWRRRLKLIESMIRLEEIRTLNELSMWCARGNIEWVDTQVLYKY